MTELLPRRSQPEVDRRRLISIGPEVARAAVAIVEDVRARGEPALREHAMRLGDLGEGGELLWGPERLHAAVASLDESTRELLIRVHGRIMSFARAQMGCVSDLTTPVEGGAAGHRWVPVACAGAYAPGGRYPLPSSVLMTVTPARVAGVGSTWVASPRPTEVTAAAAWVAGADGLLAVGGAQAVAALAFGTVTPPVEMVVGPGNNWVTAAKRHLYGEIGIDGLAGPSEILVIADDSADPALVAADLLAQAEHDPDAVPALITTEEKLAVEVEDELVRQLTDLPTAAVAREALGNGFSVVVGDLSEASLIAEAMAPEHLALHVGEAASFGAGLSSFGSVFFGDVSAEAFADYGAGPNHVLPTAGGARFASGLSVFTFLRAATWLTIDNPRTLMEDTIRLARIEGLEAHARAALARS